MKKILLTTIIACSFFACKKDSNSTQSNYTMADIAGRWRITDETRTVSSTGQTTNTYSTSYSMPCDQYSTYTFKTTGIADYRDSCSSQTFPYQYTLSGNVLGLPFGKSTIESLSTTQLVVAVNDTIMATPQVVRTTLTRY
ncbi:MAG: hypothetical protein NTZ59_04240 [Bacteroidetes bacterium]|jgi:hypothetical protein|nr:hypothetical protein [Bacteroidota bacterium]